MLKTFKRIWRMSNLRHKDLISSLILCFFRSSIAVCEIGAIMLTLDALISGNNNPNTLYLVIGLTLGCILGTYIFSYFEQIASMKAGLLSVSDKRMSVANRLMDVPLGYFKNTSQFAIASTLTTTLSGLEMASPMVIVVVISGFFNSLSLFIFMMIYDFRIGLLTGLGMVVYLLVVAYQMKVSRKNANKLQKAQTELTKSTIAFIKGIKVTKSNSYNDGDIDLKKAIEGSKKENLRLTDSSMPTQFLSKLVIAFFEGVILLASLYLLLNVKDISVSKAIILMIFSFMSYASLNQAGSMLSMIGMVDEALIETEKLENAPILETNKPYLEPTSNDIELDNVCFSYGDNEVIHNLSMKVKENSLTAIIGPSGSGKTTLCELISRFFDVNKGVIKIGNVDIRNIKYDELMDKISMVFQHTYLFEDTILNNIRFARPNASLSEVKAAAKKAACDDFIESLPNGYNTLISEAGDSLSGGEKQRIAIARAILKDSPIIILDEATASLDNDNEDKAMESIKELTKNKTVIMIAHKLETVKNADQIIALDNGKIVECGTHSELIKKEGIYKKFIDIKAKAMAFKINN